MIGLKKYPINKSSAMRKNNDNVDRTSGKSRENPGAHMKNEPGSGKAPAQVEKQRTKEFRKVDKREKK